MMQDVLRRAGESIWLRFCEGVLSSTGEGSGIPESLLPRCSRVYRPLVYPRPLRSGTDMHIVACIQKLRHA